MARVARPSQLISVFDGRVKRASIASLVRMTLAASVMAFAGCQGSVGNNAHESGTPSRNTAESPQVGALELRDQAAGVALQQIADVAVPEVAFLACGDLLDMKVTVRTPETTVAVVMAHLVTQLAATASVDERQWTLHCRDGAGPGMRFVKGQPAEMVMVPKVPEGKGLS